MHLPHAAAPEHWFAGLNPLDWALVVVIGVSVVSGLMRGLIRSLVSLVGLALGLLAAAWYAPVLAARVGSWLQPMALARVVAFLLVFAVVFAAVSLLGSALRQASRVVGLGFFDRLGGGVFGVLRAVLLLAAVLVPLAPLLSRVPFTDTSVLLPYLRTAAHGICFVVPQNFGERLAAGVRQTLPADSASRRHGRAW